MSANNSTPTDSSTSGAGAITIRPQVVFTLALTAALATYGWMSPIGILGADWMLSSPRDRPSCT